MSKPLGCLRLAIVLITLLSAEAVLNATVVHGAGPLSGSVAQNPLYILVGGNVSFTGTAIGGTGPYKYNWTLGDSSQVFNGSFITHIYKQPGTYTLTLNITDTTLQKFTVTQTITVHGSPLNIDGWAVNWNMTSFHGIEIYNVTYNGVPTIRDALINGIQVTYFQEPPGYHCIFFDDLAPDDLSSTIGGLTVQSSTDPSNPWFQIKAQYNPSAIGYNYTQYWRFYMDGRWDATLYVGHLGCGWNHTYQPHFRISLAVGNMNQNLMSQYAPGGSWRNLVWEGNYTDNGNRDNAHNSTEWRIGDGIGYYYMTPVVIPWAKDMPLIHPKIYLVRDHRGELETDYGDTSPPAPVDPINFVNGELAYRQNIAFWFLPTFGDHWLSSPGLPQVAPPSIVSLQFYPNGI